jgi:hypothetical protein
MQQQVRSATTGNAPNATSAESTAEESSRAESTVYTSNADQQQAITGRVSASEESVLLEEGEPNDHDRPLNYQELKTRIHNAFLNRMDPKHFPSKAFKLNLSLSDVAADIQKAPLTTVISAISGLTKKPLNTSDLKEGVWPSQAPLLLDELYRTLTGPARARMVVAAMRDPELGAQAAAWFDDLHFQDCDPTLAKELFEARGQLAKDKAGEIWARLIAEAPPVVIAYVDFWRWPEGERASFLARIAKDETAFAALSPDNRKGVASWLNANLSVLKTEDGHHLATRMALADISLFRNCASAKEYLEQSGLLAKLTLPQLETWLEGRTAPHPDHIVAELERRRTLRTTSVDTDPAEKTGGPNGDDTAPPGERSGTSSLGSGSERGPSEDERTRLLKLRFGSTVLKPGEKYRNTNVAQPFGAEGVEDLWGSMEGLPEAHVAGIKIARAKTNEGSKAVSGAATGGPNGGPRVMDFSFTDKARMEGKLSDFELTKPRNGLPDARSFPHAVRHEVGHLVDNQYGVMHANSAKAEYGGWKPESAQKMLTAADVTVKPNAKVTPTKPQRTTSDKTGKAAEPMDPLALLDSQDWGGANLDAIEQTLEGKGKEKLMKYLRSIDNAPDPSDPTDYGGRVYTYASGWKSYLTAARARRVSDYQFHTPSEWFAEAYAAYYEDPKKPGEALAKVDPVTAANIAKLPTE